MEFPRHHQKETAGHQRLARSSSISLGDTLLSIEVPVSAHLGSVGAEVVVYSNLIAQVSDAIEGIMSRPSAVPSKP